MRALIQRTSGAKVTVQSEVVGEIGSGLVVFVCAMQGDSDEQSQWLARKIAKLRIFRDENDRMNRSVQDTGGAVLVISQFTLAAETRGNRPGFSQAASPQEGERLYEHFKVCLGAEGVAVSSGQFGADMAVSLINDGPVTIWLDSEKG